LAFRFFEDSFSVNYLQGNLPIEATNLVKQSLPQATPGATHSSRSLWVAGKTGCGQGWRCHSHAAIVSATCPVKVQIKQRGGI